MKQQRLGGVDPPPRIEIDEAYDELAEAKEDHARSVERLRVALVTLRERMMSAHVATYERRTDKATALLTLDIPEPVVKVKVIKTDDA